ncbi:cytochrome P450 [Halogeometricum borinquense]|uniref:Cytochrome P450 n=1 Tax=Halogeometricum borinquense TaxID=60847 RepID=A0A6C0UH43_9EURY|nr:cytochrome P450 [Halogeometricum borinquense]QIB74527.1 cytochrome P450 [Halogeometricum borinquense]QIQ76528.1 cytochrome P450 [Halogeometricum borinquense]
MGDNGPPTPGGLPVLGNTVAFARDPFSFIDSAVTTHGDVIRLSMLGRDRYIVAHPDLFERALVTDRDAFVKTEDFRLAFGDSVLAVDGDEWREQRDLLDPFFFFRQITDYIPKMRKQADRRAESWTPGQTYSAVEEMKGLTFDILGSTLLGQDPGKRSGDDSLRRAADDLNAYFAPTSWALPGSLPTPSRRRFNRAVTTLREEVDRLLAADHSGDDLLSVLAEARGKEGYPRSETAVSDQLVGIIFAGHETTALALTYTWYLLSEHPSVRERVENEIDEVVGDDPVGAEHLSDLTFLERVIQESLRVYPPIHTLPRTTTREIELGGYSIPEESEVLLSVRNVHRDERFFEQPDQFDPDRWERNDVPEYAYVPFGAGPRRCIGQSFAMIEAKTALTELMKRYRLEWAGNGELDLSPQMTTQPRGDVPMIVRER